MGAQQRPSAQRTNETSFRRSVVACGQLAVQRESEVARTTASVKQCCFTLSADLRSGR